MTAIDPAVQRRNLILGLILGGIVLALTTTWIAVFTRSGLPKDPELWKRLQDAATFPAAPAAPALQP